MLAVPADDVDGPSSFLVLRLPLVILKWESAPSRGALLGRGFGHFATAPHLWHWMTPLYSLKCSAHTQEHGAWTQQEQGAEQKRNRGPQ